MTKQEQIQLAIKMYGMENILKEMDNMIQPLRSEHNRLGDECFENLIDIITPKIDRELNLGE